MCSCQKVNKIIKDKIAEQTHYSRFFVKRIVKRSFFDRDIKETMWGLCSKFNISKGAVVINYVGEIINDAEGDERGRRYDKLKLSYLLDLPDFSERRLCLMNDLVEGKMKINTNFRFPLV